MMYLGLGSNIGDREGYLARAVELLGMHVFTSMHISDIYTSPALLKQDSPEEWDIPFLNMVVGGTTLLSAEEVLHKIKEIESILGKQKRGTWAPREIDIDLVCYYETIINTPDLTLPHTGIEHRDFVLLPLQQIAPNWKHAVNKQTVSQLIDQLTITTSQPWLHALAS